MEAISPMITINGEFAQPGFFKMTVPFYNGRKNTTFGRQKNEYIYYIREYDDFYAELKNQSRYQDDEPTNLGVMNLSRCQQGENG